jgi:hypothetical protein
MWKYAVAETSRSARTAATVIIITVQHINNNTTTHNTTPAHCLSSLLKIQHIDID